MGARPELPVRSVWAVRRRIPQGAEKSLLEDYSASTPGLLANAGDRASMRVEAEGCLPP